MTPRWHHVPFTMQRPRAGCKQRLRSDLRAECGSIRVDAVSAVRCIGPGSRIEHRAVGSVQDSLARLLCTGRSYCARRPEGDAERSCITDQSIRSNAAAALPSLHDLRTSTIIVDERRTGSNGLAPVKDLTPAAPRCLSCLVCDRVRSLAQVEPLRPARTMEKVCSLRNTAVCRSCTGANTCPRFQGLGGLHGATQGHPPGGSPLGVFPTGGSGGRAR